MKVLALVMTAAVMLASVSAAQYPSQQLQYNEEPRPYQFNYGVQDQYSGANFGHNEKSDGNAVKGSYQVALPDGRIQIVRYVADHVNGYQAEVEYQGEAQFPDQKSQLRPQYS
ncbi:Insect cuticle protein [Trinorchestia longiramus]|nr:Insect cuticle protein [Trinorchestia longiramus]